MEGGKMNLAEISVGTKVIATKKTNIGQGTTFKEFIASNKGIVGFVCRTDLNHGQVGVQKTPDYYGEGFIFRPEDLVLWSENAEYFWKRELGLE
jgi:hypothetical protein